MARAENNNNEQPQEQPLPADNDNINNNNSNDNSNRPSAHVEGDSRDTLVRSSSSSGRKKRSRKVASHLLEVTDALHQLSDTFPKFFIVSSEDHVGVYQDPLLQSTQIREISPVSAVLLP